VTVFRGVLPDSRATWFLRACLHDTKEADDAWRRWLQEATADGTPVRRALAPVNALLPLLAWNITRTGIRVDRELQTHLRSALLTEELRWARYRSICEAAFTLLTAHAIPFIALKGAAVGERFYPQPLLRHSDDIDVLVHGADIDRATGIFLDAGWRRHAEPPFRQPLHAPPLVHDTDVSIELHHRLVIPHFTLPYDELWRRAGRTTVAGVPVEVLAAPDALLHALAHATQSATGLRWVADAWFMTGSPSLDWEVFTDTAIRSRLALPVSAALSYLAAEINVAVPATVTAELHRAARQATHADRQASRPWQARRAFPPPFQFALHYDVPIWSVPYYYVSRVAHAARGRWARTPAAPRTIRSAARLAPER
jgi:hypothetical protein